MRARRILPAAFLGAVALALVPALPAAAAEQTWSGTGGLGQWWGEPGVWSGASLADGDTAIFSASGGVQTESSINGFPGNALSLAGIRFDVSHDVTGSGTAVTLGTGGVSVAGGAEALLNSNLIASGAQTWTVASGGRLTLPALTTVAGASTLTLDVDGILEVGPAGNLGGGGVGTCPGAPAGLLVTEGEVTLYPVDLGGKDFAVTGGVLTGGATIVPAVVHALNLAEGGMVSPGNSGGISLGMLAVWAPSTWDGGVYQVDLDPDGGFADLVRGDGQPIAVNGTRLDVRLLTSAPAGTWSRIMSSTVGVTGQFAAPDGTLLADGDEFVSHGQVYTIRYVAGAEGGVDLAWLRTAPVPPAPGPALPATGQEIDWVLPVGIAAGVLVAAGIVFLVVRGVRSRRSDEAGPGEG